MTRTEAEPAADGSSPRVVVTGAVLFNARQQAVRSFNPFFTMRPGSLEELLAFEDLETPGWQGAFHEEGNLVGLDLASAHQSRTEYDALLRVIKSTNPDGTFGRTEFEPLATRVFDANDTDAASAHFNTPTVQFVDGLGRLVQVDEIVRLNEDGTPSTTLQTWSTRYTFDLHDRLTRITDSQNNVKDLRYDGLRRKVWMNDPDAGISTHRYDAASNLIETTDAKGQRITYTYDGANRILTEDYHDEASPEFSYGRTPDLAYHYDVPIGPVDQGNGTQARARNVRGMLAWVEDTTGEEHTSYDQRGRVEWTVKRVLDPELSPNLEPRGSTLVAYQTVFEYDSMDRVTRMVYPDNDEVAYLYNARGLLQRITGGPTGSIVSGIAYLPSAQQDRVHFGNGVQTTYQYDSRLRLKSLLTVAPSSSLATPLIDFAYDLDPASNIRSIADRRPQSAVPPDDPRRNSQTFAYDDLYRLTRADYNLPNSTAANGGSIRYRYDRIGNVLAQSSDIAHVENGRSVTDLGTMDYGGIAGRSHRAGRQPGDPPGPHALSELRAPSSELRTFLYDANGNVTESDGMRCTWDFRDRLVAVEDEAMRAEYRYDYTGRRVLKRVFWKQGGPTAQGQPPPVDPLTSTKSSSIGKFRAETN
jgi:YD repeat-containing protein